MLNNKKYIADCKRLLKTTTGLVYLDHANVAIEPGGFVAYNPLTIPTHTELLIELFLGDAVLTEEVRKCQTEPYRVTIVWMRLRAA